MQHSSEPLLKSASVEVLEKTGEAAAKVNMATVDAQARQKEFQAMMASGKICGVGRSQEAA